MARSIGDEIAAIARREARPPRGTAFSNKDGGKGYYSSGNGNMGRPEYWCADFVKWVWHKAGALNTDTLNAAAASFASYGRLRSRNPRVGDAVLFGYRPKQQRANHVAIVIRVHPDGKITTIGGDENGIGQSEASFSSTSGVYRDGPYSVSGSLNPGGCPISGFVSPVEDDMPFTDKEIVKLVKKGVAAELSLGTTQKQIKGLVKEAVAAELNAPIGRTGITPAQGAQAAVAAENALAALAQQVADLTALIKALPAATPAPAGTQTPTGTGTQTPTGTRKPTGTTRAPTGTTRTPARTRTATGARASTGTRSTTGASAPTSTKTP